MWERYFMISAGEYVGLVPSLGTFKSFLPISQSDKKGELRKEGGAEEEKVD